MSDFNFINLFGVDPDKVPTVLYEDACDQHAAATVVYAKPVDLSAQFVEGTVPYFGLLFWDANGERPITNGELCHLFANGMLIACKPAGASTRIISAMVDDYIRPTSLGHIGPLDDYIVGVACLYNNESVSFLAADKIVNAQNADDEP